MNSVYGGVAIAGQWQNTPFWKGIRRGKGAEERISKMASQKRARERWGGERFWLEKDGEEKSWDSGAPMGF